MKERYEKNENAAEYTPDTHPFGRQKDEMPVFATRLGRFFYWFKNIFWFHHKWHVAAGIAVAVLLAVFVSDILGRSEPVFQFVVASNSYIDDESLAEMTDIASSMFGEQSGNGQADCVGYGLYMEEDGEMSISTYSQMAAFLVDSGVRFFIFDAGLLETFFDEPEGFADLSDIGIRTVPGKPWLADLTGLPLTERSRLAGIPCYAAIQLSESGDKDAELSDSRCFAFLDAILNTP